MSGNIRIEIGGYSIEFDQRDPSPPWCDFVFRQNGTEVMPFYLTLRPDDARRFIQLMHVFMGAIKDDPCDRFDDWKR